MANGLSAAELRKLSAKCRRIADETADERISSSLREMAVEFRMMADRLDTRSRV